LSAENLIDSKSEPSQVVDLKLLVMGFNSAIVELYQKEGLQTAVTYL
jgi:hypothetical protein